MQLRATNIDRGTVVARSLESATGLLARFLGLMARRALSEGSGLWLQPCSGIHTAFVRFPLDALFLDADGRVLRAVPGLRPWRVVPWVPGARSVLELPAGSVQRSQTRVGDRILIF